MCTKAKAGPSSRGEKPTLRLTCEHARNTEQLTALGATPPRTEQRKTHLWLEDGTHAVAEEGKRTETHQGATPVGHNKPPIRSNEENGPKHERKKPKFTSKEEQEHPARNIVRHRPQRATIRSDSQGAVILESTRAREKLRHCIKKIKTLHHQGHHSTHPNAHQFKPVSSAWLGNIPKKSQTSILG